MPKNLVIMESPSKAVTVKSYLGANYKVVASKGHVRDLPKSKFGVDVENNFEAKYINIRGKAPLINELKKEAKAASKVYIATDPDREGEAIAWHLATALNIPLTETCRVTFNEVSKTMVKNAIKSPRNIDMNLVNSQQTRRILDRIVGYKLSPFLWHTVKSGLSAGRVQSVATRIIVEREEEIRAFVPQEYWTIDANLETPDNKTFTAKFYGDAQSKTKIEITDKEQADTITAAVKDGRFQITSVKKSVRLRNPQPPFTTSTLLQEASNKLNFQSQRIMKVAQELYEGINIGAENGGMQGLISYMRTDSTRISAENAEAARSVISAKYGEKYCPEKQRVYKSEAEAQDAHEAIHPVSPSIEPDAIKKYLSTDQYRLYKLIWSRFIASQMTSAELDTVTAEIENGQYLFRASGYTVRFQGYMAVYEAAEPEGSSQRGRKDSDDENTPLKTKLPNFSEGGVLSLVELLPLQHFTEPPPRYTEASLIKFFKEQGIGRPSTYTPTISTIISRGYVEREGKALKPTELGEITTHLMVENFPNIMNYKFTAQMEDNLDEIENGRADLVEILQGFYKDIEVCLDKAQSSVTPKNTEAASLETTDIVCEKCGSKMVIRYSRYGKFAACPNYPQCKNTKPLNADGQVTSVEPVYEKTDLICDICGKEMVLRHGRYGDFYACIDYPTCKNTKPLSKKIGIKCPLCDAELVVKQSKRKINYYTCEKYPECKFSSWDEPLERTCPNCAQMLYRKRAKGQTQVICHNKECKYKEDPVLNVNNDDNDETDNATDTENND